MIEKENILDKEKFFVESKKNLDGPLYSVTFSEAANSTGGIHDYYSEGTYLWPDEKNPGAPYVGRDGEIYPGAFFDHANSIIAFSDAVSRLAVAYDISGEDKYLKKIISLLDTWFINETTYMAPHLEYAQAIPGTCTGRCFGIIDSHHLAEVTIAIRLIEKDLPPVLCEGLRHWFRAFNKWLTSSDKGLKEKLTKNNHAIYWLVQVAAYSIFIKDLEQLEDCKRIFKEKIIAEQVEPDGSMPQEIKRTKSYAYSAFATNGLAILGELFSSDAEDMFYFSINNGRSIGKAMEFLYPYFANEKEWAHRDISEYTPESQSPIAPLFTGSHLNMPEYIELWKSFRWSSRESFEFRRDQCVKQAYLWL